MPTPTAAERLVSTVNNTGGALRYPGGTVAPAGDPDWIDLGDAYLAACAELGREPKIVEDLRQQREEGLEVMCAVVLSTEHVTPDTMELLEAAEDRARFVCAHGVIVFVPTETNDDEEPEDLAKVFDFCRERDFEWVRFDSDGPTVDGLPVYEWE